MTYNSLTFYTLHLLTNIVYLRHQTLPVLTWPLALSRKPKLRVQVGLINEVNTVPTVSDIIQLWPHTSCELQEMCSKYTPSRSAPSQCTVGQINPYPCGNTNISQTQRCIGKKKNTFLPMFKAQLQM